MCWKWKTSSKTDAVGSLCCRDTQPSTLQTHITSHKFATCYRCTIFTGCPIAKKWRREGRCPISMRLRICGWSRLRSLYRVCWTVLRRSEQIGGTKRSKIQKLTTKDQFIDRSKPEFWCISSSGLQPACPSPNLSDGWVYLSRANSTAKRLNFLHCANTLRSWKDADLAKGALQFAKWVMYGPKINRSPAPLSC